MKKVITTAILVSSLFVGGAVFAQSPQATLPSAGLTPESNFYFLDKFGEALREFFTFNPEGKARLQITFAAERIAEIKVILETRRAGDTAQVESLIQQLGQIKAQKELLELKEEEAEEALEQEEERLEEEMEAKDEAEKAIREAEKEKQEVLDEAAEEDVAVPAEAFGKFDSLLAQANSAFAVGNYQEAKRFAKQAEKNAERLEKKQEKAEEATQKAEEQLRDAGDKEKSN